jgi:predicted permease
MSNRFFEAGPWSDLGGDLRFALRGIRRSPAFSLTVVATLAVGLGLTAAIFSFADGYLFRPLPFPGGNRTYYVEDPNTDIGMLHASDATALRQSAVAGFGFVEWDVARGLGGALVSDGRQLDAFAYEVSPGFRSTLKLPLIAGRDFTADDHTPGAPRVAWLSYRYWQHEFGGDRSVVGRTLRVEPPGTSRELSIVGILGPEVTSFDLNNRPPDLVLASQARPQPGPNQYAGPLVLLPPGVSVALASQQIAAVLQAAAPAADGKPRAVALRSLQSAQVAGGRPTARVFFIGALLVLTLAAFNLVHLLLSRCAARAAEVATRSALGAARWRIARLFLVESVVLGTAGIAAGLALGKGLSAVIAANVPQFPTAGRNLALVPMIFDARVMAFAVTLGLVIVVVGGLWPAWRALRGSLHLRSRAAGGSSSGVPRRLAQVILTSELTVATVVLIGSAFLGLGIYRYLTQPIGFETDDRARVAVSVSGRWLDGQDLIAALTAIRTVPGVTAAGLDVSDIRTPVDVPGRSVDPRSIRAARVPSGYFTAWGMKLRSGRWFSDADMQGAGDVAIVNAAFAEAVWPGVDAMGQTVRVDGVSRQVVGIVESRKTLLDREPLTLAYVPGRDADARGPILVWAPGVDSRSLNARLSGAMRTVAPGATLRIEPVSFDVIFARSAGEARFQAPVMAAFGLLAIIVAGIGVFGLISYQVEQRRREFGIRIALGARQFDVWRTVIRESIQPTIAGVALGSLGAYALESIVRSKAFGWQSSGLLALGAVTMGLLVVALVAALVPAARAARTDPAVTLRSE